MESKLRIVIIGGGTAGVIAGNVFGRKVGKQASITLISKRESILYEPDNLFRLFDKKGIEKQFKSLAKVLNREVQIIIDTVVKVDPQNQIVFTKNGKKFPYNYLLIASGAKYSYDRVPGYNEAVYHFYSPEAALKLREALEEFAERGRCSEDPLDIVTGPSDLPYKCPVATLEFAFMAQHYFKKKKLLKKVRINYLSPLASAFSIERVNKKVEKRFEKQGIKLHTFFNVESIDPKKKIVYSLEGDEISYDLLVLAPPHIGQDYVTESGLGDDDSWAPIDRFTLEHKDYDNIYAIGDASDLPVSKSGSAAHHSARIAAKRVISRLKGKKPKKKYNGEVQCFLMTSLNSSLFLDFSYTHQPRRIFLWDIFSRPFYLFKKHFSYFYFKLVLSGRV